MHATSTRSALADAITRHVVSIAVYGAVACALSPVGAFMPLRFA
jgi:hypothetical protein